MKGPLRITYATLSVQSVSNYGTMSIVNVRITNVRILPKIYKIKVTFMRAGKVLSSKTSVGVILGHSSKVHTFESGVTAELAVIELTGVLGLRKYDKKVIYPS